MESHDIEECSMYVGRGVEDVESITLNNQVVLSELLNIMNTFLDILQLLKPSELKCKN